LIRFIHSSDLHLGKPFGRFPEDVRARLRQARAEALANLGTLARANNASHILLAGDTFDQMTPAPNTVRQALNAMAAADHVTWVLMPGNHDHANATELWRTIAADAPPNVLPQLEAAPFALTDTATLLPAPPTERHPGRDLTDWFETAPTGEAIRIGLAHGSVTAFGSSQESGSSIIPADRAVTSKLDYLGLGDWHGQVKISDRTWYSGTPEADSFKHADDPSALLVELAGKGAPAQVTPLPSSQLTWQRADIELTGDEPSASMHDAALPALTDRATTIFQLVVTGRTSALEQVALEKAAAHAAPDFLWHEADFTGLGMVHDTSDLDRLDRHGALRSAAQQLLDEATNEDQSEAARATAQTALSYLFSYALEGE